jgi:hypothetical protein
MTWLWTNSSPSLAHRLQQFLSCQRGMVWRVPLLHCCLVSDLVEDAASPALLLLRDVIAVTEMHLLCNCLAMHLGFQQTCYDMMPWKCCLKCCTCYFFNTYVLILGIN